jgi:N-acyl-D-aspartate/D-glutamate deacylase
MAFDLVVKNGMIVDGSGLPRFRGDVAVKDGRIAEIGRLDGVAAKETLDAEGHVVSPPRSSGIRSAPRPATRA